MAKYYLLPKRLVDRLPAVQTPVWLMEAGVFYLLLGVAMLLPFPVAREGYARLMGFFGIRGSDKRRAIGRNLAVVLPDASDAARARVAHEIFRTAGRAAVELFVLGRLWRRRARYLEFDLHPEARAAIEAQEAIVFATAHVGAWQLSPLIGREYGLSISVLYTPERNPWLDRFFRGRRRAFGGPIVPSAGGARDFLRELAAGRSVGAAFDTRIDQGEMVPFFGVPTQTSTMPAVLALRGYRLIPTRVVRLPRCRYRIEVLAPLTPTDPDAPRKAQVRDLTAQLNRVYEGWIREDPGEWLCMKRRWPKPRRAARVSDV